MLENLKVLETKKRSLQECLRRSDLYNQNMRQYEEQAYMQDKDDI